MKPLPPNSMIQNRYLIVQPIGKGGMGEVYLSVDQRLGSAVALKRTFFTEDNTLAAAFEREARILARLRHPVLPKVIDHFVENGDQYLVMEHISGDDLSKRLEAANKPFPLSWVMFWADQLLDALSYLHAHEPPIIHRDIKPQNLKLTDENHIVLLDFGLSKDFDTKATSNPLNSASVAGYSPHFASMEQIRGTGTDARSDIYSLSATLYQLMANTVPVDALTRADALLGGKPDPIVPIDKLNPEVTPAISEVILKGVAVRQDERFSTAGEMQKALRRAFDRGKKDTEASPTPVIARAPEAELAQPKTDSIPSEMETRALTDTGKLAMEQTVQMDELPVIEEIKQSDVKTEMFSASDIPEVETKLATVPPEVQTPAAPSAPPSPVAAAASPPAAVQVQNAPAQTPTAPAKKGGSSKVGFAIGGLIGLLVLTAAGIGGGYYLYSTNNAAKPTSTPSPMPSAEPTVTVPIVTQSNSNSSTDNSNSEIGSSNTGESNTSTPTSGPGPSQTRPTPQVSTKATPSKPATTPASKPTPNAKPKDDRTVIIQ